MEALKGIVRDKLGTTESRRLRQSGKIPGIIYGHGEANVAFAIDAHDFSLVLQHGERLVKMELNNTEDNYLIKAIQRDAFDNDVVHVDFTRVSLDETVELTVPLDLRGTAAGEAAGGVLTPGVTELTITCPVVAIPEQITVRVNDLNVGDVIRVEDIPAIEGVTILTDAQSVVVSCSLVAEEAEPEEGEEGAAEPEVIGKGKAEEEEGE